MNTLNLNHGLAFVVFWDMGLNTKGIDVRILSPNVFVSLVMSSSGSIRCFLHYLNFTSLKILLFLSSQTSSLISCHLLKSHHQMIQTIQPLINLTHHLLILPHHLNHCHQTFRLQTSFHQWPIPRKMPRLLILSVNQQFFLPPDSPLG